MDIFMDIFMDIKLICNFKKYKNYFSQKQKNTKIKGLINRLDWIGLNWIGFNMTCLAHRIRYHNGKNNWRKYLVDAIFVKAETQEKIRKSCSYVQIPRDVSDVRQGAFQQHKSIKHVIIPSSIHTINRDAFDDCTSLKTIYIPNSVKTIGHSAFSYCFRVKKIIIGNSVKVIHPFAFGQCLFVTSIIIPESVETLHSCAFYSLVHLSKITIPKKFINALLFDIFHDKNIYKKEIVYY